MEEESSLYSIRLHVRCVGGLNIDPSLFQSLTLNTNDDLVPEELHAAVAVIRNGDGRGMTGVSRPLRKMERESEANDGWDMYGATWEKSGKVCFEDSLPLSVAKQSYTLILCLSDGNGRDFSVPLGLARLSVTPEHSSITQTLQMRPCCGREPFLDLIDTDYPNQRLRSQIITAAFTIGRHATILVEAEIEERTTLPPLLCVCNSVDESFEEIDGVRIEEVTSDQVEMARQDISSVQSNDLSASQGRHKKDIRRLIRRISRNIVARKQNLQDALGGESSVTETHDSPRRRRLFRLRLKKAKTPPSNDDLSTDIKEEPSAVELVSILKTSSFAKRRFGRQDTTVSFMEDFHHDNPTKSLLDKERRDTPPVNNEDDRATSPASWHSEVSKNSERSTPSDSSGDSILDREEDTTLISMLTDDLTFLTDVDSQTPCQAAAWRNVFEIERHCCRMQDAILPGNDSMGYLAVTASQDYRDSLHANSGEEISVVPHPKEMLCGMKTQQALCVVPYTPRRPRLRSKNSCA